MCHMCVHALDSIQENQNQLMHVTKEMEREKIYSHICEMSHDERQLNQKKSEDEQFLSTCDKHETPNLHTFFFSSQVYNEIIIFLKEFPKIIFLNRGLDDHLKLIIENNLRNFNFMRDDV